MSSERSTPIFGNAASASKDTRGWFLGHFMPGDGSPLKTLNILICAHFVVLFPGEDISLEKAGDFALFGPDVPHSFRSEEESLVLSVRGPSRPPDK